MAYTFNNFNSRTGGQTEAEISLILRSAILKPMMLRQSNHQRKSLRRPPSQSPAFMLIREGAERHPGMHWTWWRCLLRVVICCISLRKTIFWRSGRCHADVFPNSLPRRVVVQYPLSVSCPIWTAAGRDNSARTLWCASSHPWTALPWR